MVSKIQSEKSNAEREEPTIVSVFDFIYHDGRRVASFLSQYDKSGHLTEIAQSARTARVREEGDKTHGTLGLVSGEMAKSVADEYGKESQRIYDPTWANARVLLDYLDEAGRIQRDISDAQIGQFVLVSGQLSISDLQLMEKTWRLPTIKSLMMEGASNQMKMPDIPKGQRNNPELLRLKKLADDALKSTKDATNLFFELITILPHTVQARLAGSAPVWCSLNRDGMTFDPSDLVLKYGSNIPGTWHVLGILDALPDDEDLANPAQPNWGHGEEMAVKMMGMIAPITRNFLGRPSDFYGVTPLLVFRVVED